MQLKVTSTRHASIHVRPFFNHSARTLACLLARSLAVLFLFSWLLSFFVLLMVGFVLSWFVLLSFARSLTLSLARWCFVCCVLAFLFVCFLASGFRRWHSALRKTSSWYIRVLSVSRLMGPPSRESSPKNGRHSCCNHVSFVTQATQRGKGPAPSDRNKEPKFKKKTVANSCVCKCFYGPFDSA